jgi:L-rhamnose-H+ transport protein
MHIAGALLIILGGMMEGLFALPVKLTPRWSWENIWGAGSLAALLFVPVPLLWLSIPHFWNVYAATPGWTIACTVIFGAGWGFGGIFFGLGVSALGLSLGTSSIMGLIAIGGSVVPLLLQHHDQLLSRSSIALFIGICVMVIGLVVCARAGSLKAENQGPPGTNAVTTSFARGAFYCLAAGLLSALVNFALIFGAPLAQAATARGSVPAAANNAIWAIVFVTNYLINVAYCVYLGRKRGTLSRFMLPSTWYYWFLAVAMGLLWAGGIVIYGLGASMEGAYGPVFAFPVMLIVSILTGNLTGVLLGEWRGVTSQATQTMKLGVVIMVGAIVVLGWANLWTR